MFLPSDRDARAVLGLVRGAFDGVGGFDPLQTAAIEAIAASVYGLDMADVEAIAPDRADPGAIDERARRQAVALMAVLEFVEHPLRPAVSESIERAAHHLGVRAELLDDARDLANQHFRLLYMDLERQSWYTEETVRETLRGRWFELLRSKLAYVGVVPSHPIAEKWRGLRKCATGTWGRGVAEFYERHGFPFPGERHGIYELGARHDWVHVLADYETTPEGEIDVFAFIAATMADERGLVLLAFTLGLFQNGSIHRVELKEIPTARAETLSGPRAVERFADALRRGRACTVDVMGSLDLFAYKDIPLEAVRREFAVPPRAY